MQALAHPCVFPIALRALVALFPLFGVYDGFMLYGRLLVLSDVWRRGVILGRAYLCGAQTCTVGALIEFYPPPVRVTLTELLSFKLPTPSKKKLALLRLRCKPGSPSRTLGLGAFAAAVKT